MRDRPANAHPGGCSGPYAAERKIRIRAQYFGAMRAAAGTHEDELEIPADSTVHQLLSGLCGTYGEAFRSEVFRGDGENIRDDLILSLNGAIIEHRNVIDAKMTSGDVVALFPIFPGGG